MNGAVINLPPSGDVITTDSEIRAIVSDIQDWYQKLANAQLHYAFKIGGHLIELKAKAKEDGQKWGDVCERLPFSHQTANKLMAIAGNQVLSDNSAHERNLPSDWNSLYQLSRIPEKKLEAQLNKGEITPGMNRTEIKKVVDMTTKKKTAAKAEPKKTESDSARDERRAALMQAWKKAAPSDREWFMNEIGASRNGK